jgi:hypothetical protein
MSIKLWNVRLIFAVDTTVIDIMDLDTQLPYIPRIGETVVLGATSTFTLKVIDIETKFVTESANRLWQTIHVKCERVKQ